MVPVGKVRGRRRRYRALHRDAARFTIKPQGWYDFMHWHVDWDGLSNLRWHERREHLAALFVMFRRLLTDTADWTVPHQAWLHIDAFDGSQDAVSLHIANPNREDFPATCPGVVWDAEVPERLREFMTDPGWQFGRLDELWTYFLVRSRPAG